MRAAMPSATTVLGGSVAPVTADNRKIYLGTGARLLVFEPNSAAPSGYSQTEPRRRWTILFGALPTKEAAP